MGVGNRGGESGVRDASGALVGEEMFGPYRLNGLIGRGGMGEVHRAFDVDRHRTVALKRMPLHLGADPEFQARFESEAMIAARMRNPHVIPIHDYGQINGQLFIDMRLVDGVDLKSLLERDGALPPERAVRIISQVASALDAAHTEGLVHRDVKPSNVLITDDDFVYLIDFGLARDVTSPRMTMSGVAMGTLAYMAPERFDGTGDYRVDVYALACILHEALTAQAPFPLHDFLAIMNAHAVTPPPRPSVMRPGIPPAIDAVVARGMHKNPAMRYQRASELAAAARAALATPSNPSIPTVVTVTPSLSPREQEAMTLAGRRPPGVIAGVVIAAVLVAAMVALVVILALTPGDDVPEYDALEEAAGEQYDTSQPVRAAVISRIPIGTSPRNIVVSPDGQRLYATNRDDDSVSIVDTATEQITGTLGLGDGNGPEGIAITPDEKTLFVVNNGAATVDVIDVATGEIRTAQVDESPTDVAIAPDGATAYVTANNGGTVVALDTEGRRRTVVDAGRPQSLTVSGDGSTAYVTDGGTSSLIILDTAAGSVTARIPVGTGPDGVALSPDESTAYVVNLGDDTISVVDLEARTVAATVAVGERPVGVAVNPDGDTAYVTNNESDTVSVIDTATDEVVSTLPVGSWPEAVAVSPDGTRVYVVNAGDGSISVIDSARS